MINNLYAIHVDLADVISNNFTKNAKADSRKQSSRLQKGTLMFLPVQGSNLLAVLVTSITSTEKS